MAKFVPIAAAIANSMVHVSLSCLTSGLSVTTLLGVITGISTNLAANSLQQLSPRRLKQLFLGVHPNDLNHSVKRLFFKSMTNALDNVLILYNETAVSKQEKREAKKTILYLKKSFSARQNISDDSINDSVIGDFLKAPQSSSSELTKYISENLESTNISESFREFIAKHYPAQIQLCFGEGLKSPAHHDAWVAFQRMMSDEIRDIVTRIEQTQNAIKEDLSAIKEGAVGLDEKQQEELKKLYELLSDKEQFNIVLNNNISEALTALERSENELLKVTSNTNKTVKQLLELNRQQARRQQILFGAIISVLAVLLVGGGMVVYYLLTQPFNLTVCVYGWKGKDHYPLKGTGTIKLVIDNKIYTTDINREGNAIFMELPYSCSGKKARFSIDNTNGQPYFCVDSILTLNKKEVLYLLVSVRGIELAQGCIKDESSLEPIIGARVQIAGESTTTDRFGEFSLPIPVDKQEEYQEVNVYKEGYEPYRVESPMVGKHEFKFYLIKTKP